MDFSNFLLMNQEAGLMLVFLILLVYDIFASGKVWLQLTACLLFAVHTAAGFLFPSVGTAFGGMYVSTEMTVLMKNIMNIGTLIVLMQSGAWLRSEENSQKQGEFYVITFATLLGMYLMISAGNFLLLYIGMEISALPLACLAAYNKHREKSAEAGAKYILISVLASGVMMFGISYLYGAMGTLYFTDMTPLVSMSPMTIMGLVFFFAGIAFKVSIVPFHLWTADVYEGAPTGITAYLSVVSKAAAAFVLMFALWHVFGAIVYIWHWILWALAVATIVIGNLFAIRQTDIKRFFAYSSISQAGYILLGIMSGTADGMASTVYFVLVYLFSNLAVFGVIAAVENASGRTDIAAYDGFFKTNPRLTFVMMIAVFSLGGIPPFAGFFSKFFIFAAAASEGEYLLVFIALVNTVISLYYYLLIIKAMFINQPSEQPITTIRTDSYNKLSLLLCSVCVLFVGLFSNIYDYIHGMSTGM
ncbi:MAG: NADH-quinone oxidoreductase subunit N [Culturomica sp.]|jgi:NADH-quinone oxidoreductase subunit N|nr:NADH-quinone oxidoreductase subunit N [Culturomica sp.]